MIKIFLLCPGLGRIQRGYEASFQQCFNALSEDASLDVRLFKGKGISKERELTLWSFDRFGKTAKILGKLAEKFGELTGKGDYLIKTGTSFIEYASFTLSLLPYLQKYKPDIIYFSDDGLGYFLWHWRRITRQNYKLLFRNGGILPPPFPRWDYVQQLNPTYLKDALKRGEPANRHWLAPIGFSIPSELQQLSLKERMDLRSRLNLPTDRILILSVAAINQSHKRIDYLVQEVASLPEPRPYLLLLGHQDDESLGVITLANSLLGSNNFQVRTVELHEVSQYYQVADMFVLASIREGFGRVLVESMAHGLPCLAHDYEVNHFILADQGYLADFTQRGALTDLIAYTIKDLQDSTKPLLRHHSVYQRFSWEQLRSSYVEMFAHCYAMPQRNHS